MIEKKQEFGSAYLYAEDLLSGGQYHTISVEIEKVFPRDTLTAANKKKIDKPTLQFKGKEKKLVLSGVNESVIQFVIGDKDLQKSIGKTITLQPRIVSAFGDEVVAIRVIPPPGVKIRQSLKVRLGRKAVWGTDDQQQREGE